MKKKNNLWEIKYEGLIALIYSYTKKEAVDFFKKVFKDLPLSNETLDEELSAGGWRDDIGFQISHMGHSPKDWTSNKKPLLIQINYRYE